MGEKRIKQSAMATYTDTRRATAPRKFLKTSEVIVIRGGVHVLIDRDDLWMVSRFRWRTRQRKGEDLMYAVAHVPGTGKHGDQVLMHRLIMDARKGQIVDHINGDTLDNRKRNLRICTNAENVRNARAYRSSNTSQFKGVSLNGKKWRAKITVSGKAIHLGNFPTEEAAAQAYDEAARKLFGQFARLNFPPTPEAD